MAPNKLAPKRVEVYTSTYISLFLTFPPPTLGSYPDVQTDDDIALLSHSLCFHIVEATFTAILCNVTQVE